MNKVIKYYPEIDGLRALSILIVYIFHLSPNLLSGGYVGVDIFFVISGFLITSIIKSSGSLSLSYLANFYAKRMKRILPPLYCMLLVSAIVGFFLLSPSDYRGLKIFIEKTILFSSNFYQMTRDGYFGPMSAEQPLLHTWSLSIEEQFYFIWPLLLLLILKRKKLVPFFITLLIIFSLFYGQHLIDVGSSKASYFSLFSRSGELLLGALLAFVPVFRIGSVLGNILIFTGILGMVIPSVMYSKDTSFPGYTALLPTFSACVIIYAFLNTQAGFFHRIFRHSWVNYLGRTSYSLYLWHWPVMAYARYVLGVDDFSFLEMLFVTALSFTLSYISYEYVEKATFKIDAQFRYSLKWFFLLPSMAIFIVIFLMVQIRYELDSRYLRNLSRIDSEHNVSPAQNQNRLASIKGENKKILVYGDSHAGHFFNFFKEVSKTTNDSYDFLAVDWCTIFYFRPNDKYERILTCNEIRKTFLQIYSQYDYIIIALRWDAHLNEQNKKSFFESFEQGILKTGLNKVIVIQQGPQLHSSFRKRGRLLFDEPIRESVNEFTKLELSKFIEKLGVMTLDMSSLIKDAGFDYSQIYGDNNHLSNNGSKILGEYFINNWRADFGSEVLVKKKKAY